MNSFALVDVFDGVDKAMITAAASISLTVEASVLFAKIGVSGKLTLTATIDLFDAYPETSGGLVRPFQLISVGASPIDWFEFGIKINFDFEVYIRIGIFLGWIEVRDVISSLIIG